MSLSRQLLAVGGRAARVAGVFSLLGPMVATVGGLLAQLQRDLARPS